jgi:hypothetical protein
MSQWWPWSWPFGQSTVLLILPSAPRSFRAPMMSSYVAPAGTQRCRQLTPAVWRADARRSRRMSTCDLPRPRTGGGILRRTRIHRTSVVSPCLCWSLHSRLLQVSFWPPLAPAASRTPVVWLAGRVESLSDSCYLHLTVELLAEGLGLPFHHCSDAL